MRRALVVDDKEENRYYLSALLSAHGYEVDTAAHGAEALMKARQMQPSVVISDLLMPVMDGYTLLRNMRADAQLARLPFIVYTATYTAPEDEQLALQLGADAFILKPADPDEFVARLSAVDAHAEAPAAPADAPRQDEGQYRAYSEVLIRKLERKTLQLEQSNRDMQRDMAAREQAENALRESEARFRQLAESIDDVFWLSDLAGREIVYVSPAYERVWGRSCASLYAQPGDWLNAIHEEDRARMSASLDRYVSGGWDETFRIVHGDGSTRWIRSRAYPVRDGDGHVVRAAGVSRDITEYRGLEEQFRQAQKMEAVGRLAGGIAHDFNNLLSVILGYTSLAMDTFELVAPLRAHLDEVYRAGERARDLTQQLLAFSRQQVLHPRVLDLGCVLADMERMLRRLVGEDVQLTLLVPPERCAVHADASQIEQIVMNLVVNARDAMPRGGKLTIEVQKVELDTSYTSGRLGLSPGSYVMLAVSDSGIGMDAATREHIFDPFFTTKELGKGTGLGLSTVFGIVKQSHGDVHVYSEPGVGTTFKIFLPGTEREVDRDEASSPAPVSLRGTETILLVEDDDQLRRMNHSVLAGNGYQVLDAHSGGEALTRSAAHTSSIHLLLTDVVMPSMSGSELAARITERRPGIKVLFISGYTQSAIVQNGVLDHGTSFLAKPITPDALLRKVRELLGPGS